MFESSVGAESDQNVAELTLDYDLAIWGGLINHAAIAKGIIADAK